jgi:F420-dependent oxidoreductase-like protein
MKIGLQIPYYTYPGGPAAIAATFGRIVREAEAAGFDSVWVMDHFFQIGGWGPPEREMLEAYSALAYAAALTQRVTLGALVTGVTYRPPGVLIKTVTTLDVLSGGRAYLGIGAAWNEGEHRGLGVPFPPLTERYAWLEDTVRAAQQMWSGATAPFTGARLQMAQTLNSPNALQRPHPPILIGGDGEKRTLPLVARYADACNVIIIPDQGADYLRGPAQAARKYAVLQGLCETVGRPYSAIEKTTLSALIVTPDGRRPADALSTPEDQAVLSPAQAIAYFQQLADAGTDHAIFNTPIAHLPGAFDVWANTIIPAAHAMTPAGR